MLTKEQKMEQRKNKRDAQKKKILTFKGLTKLEKSKIIKGLHKEQSILEIAKSIGHDRRTVKKSAINPVSCRGRSVRKNRGRIACVISIMREFRCNPLQTNKEVLQGAWISDLPKTTQYRILKKIEKFGHSILFEGCPHDEKAGVGKKMHETEF